VVDTALPVMAIVLPALIGFAIFFSVERDRLSGILSLIASLLSFSLVVSMFPILMKGKFIQCCSIYLDMEFFPHFRVDWLSNFFALITSFLWVISILYAMKYMELKSQGSKARFFGFFTLSAASAVAVTMAGNILTLFVFYELLTVFTYPLVAHTETPEALGAAKKYLIYLMAGDSLLLFSVLFTITLGGTQTFAKIGMIPSELGSGALLFLLGTYIVGFGIKAAIFPFSDWLPSVVVAPTPVTALLHAVAVVNAGVYGIMRVILNVFGVELIRNMGATGPLIWITGLTIIFGSIMALYQDDLKRRLAFSTVANISYPVLGTALLSSSALIGGLFHLAAHALLKISLFFCAGAIDVHLGKKRVSELSGIGYEMPFTMVCFTLGSLGLMGVPLTLGFVSKWYLWRGPLEANQPAAVVFLFLSSILCALYLLSVVYIAFFKRFNGEKKISRLHWLIAFPMSVGVVAGLFFGLFPEFLLSVIKPVATTYFGR